MRRPIFRLAIAATLVFGLEWTVTAGDAVSTSIPVPDTANAADATQPVIPNWHPAVASKDLLPAQQVAAEVDKRILAELEKAGLHPAERCNDEDFLRRVSLDVAGKLPTPAEVRAFRADTNENKRAALIDELIASRDFGVNWGRYWRDVIYIRATETRSRLNQEEFTVWMAEQWNHGVGWDSTVTSMLTALGNVQEHPETALIFAQGATTEDVAAETCRVFLGIQLQCANCHDHPSDIWKREQFHQLAAFFPRITERRVMQGKPDFEVISVNTERRRGEFMHEHPDLFIRSFDRNRDNKLTKEELASGPKRPGGKKSDSKKSAKMASSDTMSAKMADDKMADKKMNTKTVVDDEMRATKIAPKQIERLFDTGDTNKDGFLTVEEIKALPVPMNKRRGQAEHYMVDLKNPDSLGDLVDPKFFVDGAALERGKTDEERRNAVAKSFTSPDNPWFARAIVNRVWAEMLGEGFYMPVDDLGPTRTARYPDAMEVICKNFVASGYDPKWLVRTVANTEAYQRKVQARPASETDLPFVAATPVPLRSDIIFSSLTQVFDVDDDGMAGRVGKGKSKKVEKRRPFLQSPRYQFDSLFGIDPSVPKDEISGNIPQSLMMMNSRTFRAGMAAKGETRLNKILAQHKDNREAIRELYLIVLARDPSPREVEISLAYIDDVKNRPESFEDIMWSLVNSSEFISRR